MSVFTLVSFKALPSRTLAFLQDISTFCSQSQFEGVPKPFKPAPMTVVGRRVLEGSGQVV